MLARVGGNRHLTKTIVPIGRMREMTLKKKIATTHFFLKMRQQNKLLHDIAYAKIVMD